VTASSSGESANFRFLSGERICVPQRPKHGQWRIRHSLTHPGWYLEYVRHGGAPTLGNWAPHAPPGSSITEVIARYRRRTPWE